MRVLFTCRPATGHYQPLVPLMEAALRGGHDVLLATGEPVVSQAASAGFATASVGLADPDVHATLARIGTPFSRIEPAQVRMFAFGLVFSRIEAPPRLFDLRRVVGAYRPDVVLHGAADLAAPLAAATAGIPWVTVDFGLPVPGDLRAAAGEGMAGAWRASGLDAPPDAGLYRYLGINPFPPALGSHGPDVPGETLHLRPASAGLRPAASAGQTSGRVYVTFGTVWTTYRAAELDKIKLAVAGAANAAREVIVTVGPRSDPAVLGPQPPHVRVHQFVPQDEVLSTCAAAVHHAGSGTLLGALSWGVPSLLLPMGADQFLNTERAVAAGLALTLPPDGVTRDAVAAQVRRLLDGADLAQPLARVRDQLRAAPDADTVIARVAALVD